MAEQVITGKLEAVVNERKWNDKDGNPQSSIDFVLKTNDTYPQTIILTASKPRAALNGVALGTEITAHYNFSGREYKDRWYNQINAWKIEVAGSAAKQQGNANTGNDYSEQLPF